ncbi:hypothetical protein BS78_05G054200 [Paspalum vaginatum]|nr:hypothetical protein BS78_05G054200 [Paspalum vaginatum]
MELAPSSRLDLGTCKIYKRIRVWLTFRPKPPLLAPETGTPGRITKCRKTPGKYRFQLFLLFPFLLPTAEPPPNPPLPGLPSVPAPATPHGCQAAAADTAAPSRAGAVARCVESSGHRRRPLDGGDGALAGPRPRPWLGVIGGGELPRRRRNQIDPCHELVTGLRQQLAAAEHLDETQDSKRLNASMKNRP